MKWCPYWITWCISIHIFGTDRSLTDYPSSLQTQSFTAGIIMAIINLCDHISGHDDCAAHSLAKITEEWGGGGNNKDMLLSFWWPRLLNFALFIKFVYVFTLNVCNWNLPLYNSSRKCRWRPGVASCSGKVGKLMLYLHLYFFNTQSFPADIIMLWRIKVIKMVPTMWSVYIRKINHNSKGLY